MIQNVLLFFSLIPKIVPLSLGNAKKHINSWVYDAYANNNLNNAQLYSRSLELYKKEKNVKLGCISVINEEKISAIALLKTEQECLKMIDLCCCDYSSGTLLVNALYFTSNKTIIFEDTVSDRWHIAKQYYSNSIM